MRNVATAEVALAIFVDKYEAKHPKAVDCLTKDRDPLLGAPHQDRHGPGLSPVDLEDNESKPEHNHSNG